MKPFRLLVLFILLAMGSIEQAIALGKVIDESEKKSFLCNTSIFGKIANPYADTVASNITSKLSIYILSHPIEKAYLQFDKPYYAAGDTMYFKAYLTGGEGHKLSNLSRVLHVELINTKNKIDRSIQLQLDNGLAWGDFALPDSLPQGNYRVRAYTRWMRNAPEPCFFEKMITIAALRPPGVPEPAVRHERQVARPDFQFFPEGGTLIAGLPAKIAFKAIGPDGLGISIKGVVTEGSGAQVVSFSSEHAGMGFFYLTPLAGKSYSAKITYADGSQDVIDLPKANEEGISLAINNDSLPNASISVQASTTYFNNNKNKSYCLVITSGGLITTINCKLDTPLIKLDILKRKLRTGIATVTLFSPGNEPLAERLFFVQNYDRLSLVLTTDKQTYAQREKVSITLNALNRRQEAAEGHFSVSVVNESKAPDDDKNAGNILSDLLLTSDLKGFVEQPGYYFSDTTAHLRNELDVLLLTQGYRRFEWKRVLDSASAPLAYQPEKGVSIAGRVTGMLNKPVANGTVTLLPFSGGQLLTAVTDASGNFLFSNLLFTDTAHFMLSAVNAKNKNSTQIRLIKDAAPVQPVQLQFGALIPDSTLAIYVSNDKIEQQATLNYFNSKGIMLKQVNIRERKPDDHYNTQSLAGAGNADQILHSKDLLGGQLSTSLYLLRGVMPVRDGLAMTPYLQQEIAEAKINKPIPMLVVVDGVEQTGTLTDPVDINSIPVNTVETIEVFKGARAAIYGMQSSGGVLVITTKQGGGLSGKDIPSIGVLPILPEGFYKAREFYSPRYDRADDNNQRPDPRLTIYWRPELKTDNDGNAGFEYYNADGKGTYKVTIEGIDNQGNIGRTIYRYRVD